MKYLILLCVALPFLFLTSCLDCEEEFWLNADASGAARIQLSVPASVAALHGGEMGVKEALDQFFEGSSVFNTHLVETSSEGSQLRILIVATFDNALEVLDGKSGKEPMQKVPTVASELLGATEIEFEGLKLSLRRQVEFTKVIPGSVFMPKSRFTGHFIKTTVHLPKAVTAHNADLVEDGGRTLIWSTPLEDAIKRPVENYFIMPLPIPWAVISFVLFLVILLVGTLVYYLLRRRKLQTRS